MGSVGWQNGHLMHNMILVAKLKRDKQKDNAESIPLRVEDYCLYKRIDMVSSHAQPWKIDLHVDSFEALDK